jgi:lysyl-tRNA synthetase class I
MAKKQNLELQVEKNTADIAEIKRQLDSINRYVELIYKDRELVNEVREDQQAIKQRMVDSTAHIENVVEKAQVENADLLDSKIEEVKKVVKKG